MSLDENVHVVDYNSAWPELFSLERRRVCSALGVQENDLEHIGSTAVPGLAAKPVVDLMLGVETYPPSPAVVSALERLGYESLGEAGVPGRLYFRYRGSHGFNLHVVRRGGEHWHRNRALRDYLRSHPGECEHYARVKRETIASGATRLLAYSKAKSSLVAELVSKAVEWKRSIP